MTNFICPLQPEMDTLLRQSQDIFAAIRRLRRRCKTCPAYGGSPAFPQTQTCPFWRDFNAQVQQAITEVIAELSQ